MTTSSPSTDPDHAASSADWAAMWTRVAAGGTRRLADGRWLVADPDGVEAVLRSASASPAPVGPPTDAVEELRSRMARFSDGEDHRRRRALAVGLLDGVDPAALERRAAALVAASVAGQTSVDVMDLARTVPLRALAEALGLPARSDDGAVDAVEALCRRLALRLASAGHGAAGAGTPVPGDVARALEDRFGSLDDETVVARVSLLFQAADATAALIGIAARRLLDGRGLVSAADIVAAARAEPPVQLTVRRAVADVETGGGTVPSGSVVVVGLAAAQLSASSDDPDGEPLTFGAGPHACPGRAHAVALAAGVVGALAALGARGDDRPLHHEARPNLRTPVSLVVSWPAPAAPAGDRTA